MVWKRFLNSSSKRSEAELTTFVDDFCRGKPPAVCMWKAAIINFNLSRDNMDWSKALSSELGSNIGLCAALVVQTNGLMNKLHKNGQIDHMVGMKIWNMTFRSMTNVSFHHHGEKLWTEIASRFDEVEEVAREEIRLASGSSERSTLQAALSSCRYVPPQFIGQNNKNKKRSNIKRPPRSQQKTSVPSAGKRPTTLNRERICEEVGRCLHRQIKESLGETVDGESFQKPEHIVFFSAYLKALLFSFARFKNGDPADWVWEDRYIKLICDGVFPERLWEIYQRGAGMSELSEEATYHLKSVVTSAEGSGLEDGAGSLNAADNLYRYLTGKKLNYHPSG